MAIDIEEAEEVDKSLKKIHSRQRIRKRQHLVEMFEENMGMFLRLNKQKSSYRNLFSQSKENKENRETGRKLKRCTSAVSKN